VFVVVFEVAVVLLTVDVFVVVVFVVFVVFVEVVTDVLVEVGVNPVVLVVDAG